MFIKLYSFLNKIKNSSIWKRKVFYWPIIITLILNLSNWLLVYFKFYPLIKNLPEDRLSIPLHYNIYLGIDLFGHWAMILILPTLGFIFLIFNSLLASVLYNKKELVSYFLIYLALFEQIIFLFATFLTILINI